ncbi:hypothetical protein [Pantoea sp. B65]|uniref:hypothetical protein n=1 Tax=Pantoea sp. B65 TaxID=2813359 RepID=UPI0039B4180A
MDKLEISHRGMDQKFNKNTLNLVTNISTSFKNIDKARMEIFKKIAKKHVSPKKTNHSIINKSHI